MWKHPLRILLFLALLQLLFARPAYDDDDDQDMHYGEQEDMDGAEAEYMKLYQKHFAHGFIPDENFYLEIQPGAQETFELWATVDSKTIRGHYFVDSVETDHMDEVELFAGVEVNGKLKENFKGKHFGFFNYVISDKTERYKFIFKSETHQIRLYFSYQNQLSKPQPTPKPDQQAENEEGAGNEQRLHSIHEQFNTVFQDLEAMSFFMEKVEKFSQRDAKRVMRVARNIFIRSIIETIIVIVSTSIPMLVIHRKLKNQYQPIV